ncbi:Cell wall protein [Wickerhamomyces ciferrii]|uniref:Cell wall protein n=1 Tax=Wickerhamomyces ciferrii (strain ATCC 14091 / BCRC 22168 / CBS 111 / JCM 3599 / NBRC 0793 / NRRL Y-1031 F-60-10) TaxID=1206466 RepID=K0KAQ0_WICCF|nr:Cell wall protein [Wickerhamomyces ciferrii]CCH42070.1 Cell wall protein [Wickerhamomyces ciferrii]
MRFNYTLFPLFFITSALAVNNVEYATILLNDVQNNMNDYGYLFKAESINLPTELFNYYKEIITYTDDSFTSVLTDFPVNKVQSVVTEFPWYSSRLESRLKAAITHDSDLTTSQIITSFSNSTSYNISTSFNYSSIISKNSSIDTLTPIEPTRSHISTQIQINSTSGNISSYSGESNQLNQFLPLILIPLLSLLI